VIQTSAFETDFQMGNIKSLSFENGNKNGWYGRIRFSKKKAEKKLAVFCLALIACPLGPQQQRPQSDYNRYY
jgi:hypothetical protein